jgi:RNA polymerase sigma-70 factor (ECF subfamily)
VAGASGAGAHYASPPHSRGHTEGTLKPPPETDAELIRRFRAGDQRAAAALYARYAPRLLLLARSRCGRVCAGRFDSDDVVQAVFGDLFHRLRVDPTADAPPAGLWGLLSLQALSTIRNLVKHHRAAKRSVGRTRSTDDGEPARTLADRRAGDGLFGMALREQLGLLPDRDRRIVELRLDGHEVAEIARQTGRAQRTVERVLQSFRQQLLATGP